MRKPSQEVSLGRASALVAIAGRLNLAKILSICLLTQTRSLVSLNARVFFAACGLVNISKQGFYQSLQYFLK